MVAEVSQVATVARATEVAQVSQVAHVAQVAQESHIAQVTQEAEASLANVGSTQEMTDKISQKIKEVEDMQRSMSG